MTDRLKQLEAYLLLFPASCPFLAKTLGVSADTVRRDIKKLQDLGSDVKHEKGGWRATKAVFQENATNA